MNRITIRQLVRQGNKEKIQSWLPFEIVSDGEVIAIVYGAETNVIPDVRHPSKRNTMSDNLHELPLSKKRQANSSW